MGRGYGFELAFQQHRVKEIQAAGTLRGIS